MHPFDGPEALNAQLYRLCITVTLNLLVSTILSVTSKVRFDTDVSRPLLTPHRPEPRPSKALAGQTNMLAERLQRHSSCGCLLGGLGAGRDQPESGLQEPTDDDCCSANTMVPRSRSAQPRATAPTAALPKPAVHALQAWLLACASHDRNCTVIGQVFMHVERAAKRPKRSRVRSLVSGAPSCFDAASFAHGLA